MAKTKKLTRAAKAEVKVALKAAEQGDLEALDAWDREFFPDDPPARVVNVTLSPRD